jgi:hypothetical protein
MVSLQVTGTCAAVDALSTTVVNNLHISTNGMDALTNIIDDCPLPSVISCTTLPPLCCLQLGVSVQHGEMCHWPSICVSTVRSSTCHQCVSLSAVSFVALLCCCTCQPLHNPNKPQLGVLVQH